MHPYTPQKEKVTMTAVLDGQGPQNSTKYLIGMINKLVFREIDGTEHILGHVEDFTLNYNQARFKLKGNDTFQSTVLDILESEEVTGSVNAMEFSEDVIETVFNTTRDGEGRYNIGGNVDSKLGTLEAFQERKADPGTVFVARIFKCRLSVSGSIAFPRSGAVPIPLQFEALRDTSGEYGAPTGSNGQPPLLQFNDAPDSGDTYGYDAT